MRTPEEEQDAEYWRAHYEAAIANWNHVIERLQAAEAALRAYGQHTLTCRSTMPRWKPTSEDLDRIQAEPNLEARMAIWREIDAKFAEGVKCTCGFDAALHSVLGGPQRDEPQT